MKNVTCSPASICWRNASLRCHKESKNFFIESFWRHWRYIASWMRSTDYSWIQKRRSVCGVRQLGSSIVYPSGRPQWSLFPLFVTWVFSLIRTWWRALTYARQRHVVLPLYVNCMCSMRRLVPASVFQSIGDKILGVRPLEVVTPKIYFRGIAQACAKAPIFTCTLLKYCAKHKSR